MRRHICFVHKVRIEQRVAAHLPHRFRGVEALALVRALLGAAQEPFVPARLGIQLPERQAKLEVFTARCTVRNGAVAVGVAELHAERVARQPLVKERQARRDLVCRRSSCLQREFLLHQIVKLAAGRRRRRLDRPRALGAHGKTKRKKARDKWV